MPQNVNTACRTVNVNVNQKHFNVARLAELLRSPRRRSSVTELCQEKTSEKGMFWEVDGRRAEWRRG